MPKLSVNLQNGTDISGPREDAPKINVFCQNVDKYGRGNFFVKYTQHTSLISRTKNEYNSKSMLFHWFSISGVDVHQSSGEHPLMLLCWQIISQLAEWPLNIEHWTFTVEHWPLSIQHWAFSIYSWALNQMLSQLRPLITQLTLPCDHWPAQWQCPYDHQPS